MYGRGVSDCTLGWGTGGVLLFLKRRVLLSFGGWGGGGEAFSPSIQCIPIRRH